MWKATVVYFATAFVATSLSRTYSCLVYIGICSAVMAINLSLSLSLSDHVIKDHRRQAWTVGVTRQYGSLSVADHAGICPTLQFAVAHLSRPVSVQHASTSGDIRRQ